MFFIADKPVLYHIFATVYRSTIATIAITSGVRQFEKEEPEAGIWSFGCNVGAAIALWRLCYEDYRQIKRRHPTPFVYWWFVVHPIQLVCGTFFMTSMLGTREPMTIIYEIMALFMLVLLAIEAYDIKNAIQINEEAKFIGKNADLDVLTIKTSVRVD